MCVNGLLSAGSEDLQSRPVNKSAAVLLRFVIKAIGVFLSRGGTNCLHFQAADAHLAVRVYVSQEAESGSRRRGQ